MLNFLKNLQNQREAEEERIKELVKTKTMLEGKISLLSHQVNSMAQLSADAQAQYDAKLESLRLVDSGFNALEEIGYERYVPTMESDNIEKEIFSAEFDIAALASKDELIPELIALIILKPKAENSKTTTVKICCAGSILIVKPKKMPLTKQIITVMSN